MLRINLLPAYVSQRRLTRKLVLGFSVLVLLCIAVPLALFLSTQAKRVDMENQATAAEAGKAKTDALKAQAAAQRSQIAPLKAKVDFVASVRKYNRDLVTFWNTVAQYSDPRIIYTDAQVTGPTLTLKAYAPTIAEVGRYLQAMYQEPDFTTVEIDKLPGYPDALVNKYYLDGKLVGIGTSPASAGANGANAMQNASLSLSSAPGLGGAGANGGKLSFGQVLIPSSSGGTPSGATFGETPVNIADIVEPKIPPFASPEQRAIFYQRAIQRIQKKAIPKGFEITVTATLKQPMTAPTLPGDTSATSTGGPGGIGPSGPGLPPSGALLVARPGG